ncbi:MAG: hypothetical protein ABIL58_22510 [Pseudomonadota bacterium]
MSIELLFSKHDDIAEFAAKPVVSCETIESWISAGVLTPEETAGASRILSLLLQQRMDRRDCDRFPRIAAQFLETARPRGIQMSMAALKAAAGGTRRWVGRWFRKNGTN